MTTKEDYSWSTYKHCEGFDTTLTKYCTESKYGIVDNKTVLESVDDAASYIWEGNWRMPTLAEFQELIDSCDWKWTLEKGKHGYRVTSLIEGYTNQSIFLPAAGFRYDSIFDGVGEYGCYWSSVLRDGSICFAWSLNFSMGAGLMFNGQRFYGCSVRPVCSSNSLASCTLTVYADGCETPNRVVVDRGESVSVSAVPGQYRKFVCWSDGNTDNPRTIEVTEDATYIASFVEEQTGIEDIIEDSNLEKVISNGVLYILRNGVMYNAQGTKVGK